MAQSLTSRLSRLAISSNKRSIFTSSSSAATSASTKLNPSPIILSSVRNQFNHYPGGNNSLFHSNNTSLRCLSSMIQARTIDVTNNNNNNNNASIDHGATSTLSPLLSASDAENFAAFVHANRHQKVKPFILKRRRQNLKTYIGNEKNIRHSPWRMNLVCQFAHGLTVPEALKQLMFCQKVKAPLVAKVIRRTANLADIRDGIQPSQLEVAECFTTHGTHLKRLKIMGRGRAGKKLRRFSHIRLVLREIDFPTKLLQATSINQKRKWLERLAIARDDYEKARVEKEELAELEALAAEVAAKNKEKEEKKE